MKYLILPVFIFLLSCGFSVHNVYVSDFLPVTDMKAEEQVEVTKKQFVVLGIVFDTNYVDEAYRELVSKCKEGRIHRITTRYSTALGFLSWTNQIYIKGYCNRE